MSLTSVQTTPLHHSLSWPFCSPRVSSCSASLSTLGFAPFTVCASAPPPTSPASSSSSPTLWALPQPTLSIRAVLGAFHRFPFSSHFPGSLWAIPSHGFSGHQFPFRCWWVLCASCWDREARGGAVYFLNAQQSLRLGDLFTPFRALRFMSLMNDEDWFFPKRSAEAPWKLQYLLLVRPALKGIFSLHLRELFCRLPHYYSTTICFSSSTWMGYV